MDDMSAFERLVAAEVRVEAGPSRPTDVAAVIRSAATQPPRWRFQSMFSATKYVVAGVIVALVGGFLVDGVLMHPSDERPPAVGASATATTRAEPTDAATSESEPTIGAEVGLSTTTPELLPGVDLVTEEVEPGVYRVLSDGTRGLTTRASGLQVRVPQTFFPRGALVLDVGVSTGLDGNVWVFWHDSFFRLGDLVAHRWPDRSPLTNAYGTDIEGGPDGTVWQLADGRLRAFDGQSWTDTHQPDDGFGPSELRVLSDGAVWLHAEGKGGRSVRMDAGEWTDIGQPPGQHRGRMVSWGVSDAGTVWTRSGRDAFAFDDGDWTQMRRLPRQARRFHVGPSGVVWVEIGYPDSVARMLRFDGDRWDSYPGDEIEPIGIADDGLTHVAADGTLWAAPSRPGCRGVVSFDGQSAARYLEGLCIYAMDVALDGRVWAQAGTGAGTPGQVFGTSDGFAGEGDLVGLYVIDPEAVAAGE